jgi:outer membrane protein W
MIRRLLLSVSVSAIVIGFVAPSSASAQQTVNFFVGGFVPRALESRGSDDVLVRDFYLSRNPSGFLIFDVKDFRGFTGGAEYLVGLGDFFDAGLGIGYYSRTSPAIDADFTRPGGGEVEADLKLRVIPVTATFRYLPLGHHDAIEPYVGAGVGIYNWQYTETGEFVTTTRSIIRGNFTASDTTVGPVVLGGIRVPAGRARIGGEIRWQGGQGSLPKDQSFAGSKIDLGGFNYLFTVGVRF